MKYMSRDPQKSSLIDHGSDQIPKSWECPQDPLVEKLRDEIAKQSLHLVFS